MKVRVIEAFERRTLAWIFSLLGGGLTAAVLMNVINLEDLFGWDRRWSFGAAGMLWCFGLLVGFRQPGYVAKLEDIAPRGRAISVAVARAVRGFSIAAKIPDARTGAARGFFFEAESESDARRIVAALGTRWPRTALDVQIPIRRDDYNLVVKAFAALGFVGAMLYGIMVGSLHESDWKGIGLLNIVAGLIASVMFIIEPITRQVLVVGERTLKSARGDLAEHLRVHAMGAIAIGEKESTGEAVVDSRVEALGRASDEATSAWLKRVDAMNQESGLGGYRDAAFTNEELLRIARDPASPTNVKLGATRLLTRRTKDVHFRVGDFDLEMKRHVRVVVNIEDANEAADDLDELGPAFRLRGE